MLPSDEEAKIETRKDAFGVNAPPNSHPLACGSFVFNTSLTFNIGKKGTQAQGNPSTIPTGENIGSAGGMSTGLHSRPGTTDAGLHALYEYAGSSSTHPRQNNNRINRARKKSLAEILPQISHQGQQYPSLTSSPSTASTSSSVVTPISDVSQSGSGDVASGYISQLHPSTNPAILQSL
ncbi:hypothetical protein M426DRAFT_203813 [Hypoxylon sp. CI-4A]|nr:hypothetical protein M426DRAFT_203813 [Hypoxylon sp. CI-4A]